MWLEIGNISTKLARSTAEELDWLVEYLSFTDGSFKARGARICLFNNFNRTFPSGFVSMVCKAAQEEGMSVQVIDHRVAPMQHDAAADLVWLRDYQVGAVDTVVKRKRGILWLPTGAGKTEVLVGLTRALPGKWLALVHRSQLVDEIANRYELRSPGLEVGRVMEGGWDIPPDATLVGATFQSINAALERGLEDNGDPDYLRAVALLEWADGIVVDECHTLPAQSFYRVVNMAKNAYYRVGLSGTPLARGDRRSLYAIAALGPVLYRVKTQLLVDRGVLARPTVRLVTVEQESDRPTWQGVYGECVVRSKVRNATLVNMVLRAEKPGFVFVKQTAHGKELTKMLGAAGIKAEFIWGTHSVDYRKRNIKRLTQGHFDVLVCSNVFQEGIDVPSLRSVVVGDGGKSVIATLQRLGRGMRVEKDGAGNTVEGGDQFEVWDVRDKGNKWLERHTRERMKAYAGEGFPTFVEPQPIASKRKP